MPTVLVVDDSATDRRLAGGLLERNSQLHVIYSKDGSEAIAEIERHIPDIVLTDLVMPEVDGFEFLAEIRANEKWAAIPVIIATAKTLTEEEQDRLKGNVELLLHKGDQPIEQLMQEINGAIRGLDIQPH